MMQLKSQCAAPRAQGRNGHSRAARDQSNIEQDMRNSSTKTAMGIRVRTQKQITSIKEKHSPKKPAWRTFPREIKESRVVAQTENAVRQSNGDNPNIIRR